MSPSSTDAASIGNAATSVTASPVECEGMWFVAPGSFVECEDAPVVNGLCLRHFLRTSDNEFVAPHHLHGFLRSWIDWDDLRPYIDGEHVPVREHQAFMQDWSHWYDAHKELHGCRCTGLCVLEAIAEMAWLR